MKANGHSSPVPIPLPPQEPFENEEGRLIEIITGSSALAKSCQDAPFDYALKLRSGEVIAFSGAKLINKEWIHIDVKPSSEQPPHNRLAYPAERGADIRISEIVWVMDAPTGS